MRRWKRSLALTLCAAMVLSVSGMNTSVLAEAKEADAAIEAVAEDSPLLLADDDYENPDEEDPGEEDPDEENPDEEDPDEEDPDEEDPDEEDPDEEDPDEEDPDEEDGDYLVKIDEDNFPDEAFREYILNEKDLNENDKLDYDEADAVVNLDVSSLDIGDLLGIEYFKNLEVLDCSDNEISDLYLAENTNLTELNCANNKVSEFVGNGNEALRRIDFQNNNLTSLDISENQNLEYVNVSNNHLMSLDLDYLLNDFKFVAEGNQCVLEFDEDGVCDLSEMDGFNSARVSGLTGAVLKDGALVKKEGAETISYIYNCGRGRALEVTILTSALTQNLTVSLDKNVIAVGADIRINATTDGRGKLTYATGDDDIIEVGSRGTIYALAPGKATVRVVAEATNMYREAEKEITVLVKPGATDLSAAYSDAAGVRVEWDKAEKVTGYNIYRSEGSGAFKKIATLTKNTDSYLDKKAANGKQYKYKVSAYKTIDNEVYEGEQSKALAVWYIAAPKIKSASAKKGLKIEVKWDKNKKVKKYELQYATKKNFSDKKSVNVKKAVKKVVPKLKKGKTYFVRVRAKDGKKVSAWSKVKKVKVKK